MSAPYLEQKTEKPAEDSRATRRKDSSDADPKKAVSQSMPVCVAGMHRSGTSMVSRLLNLCGFYLGTDSDLVGPSEHNIKGYWENKKLLALNEQILAHMGGGWDLPPVIPSGWESGNESLSFKKKAEEIAGDFAGRDAWGWKDPRNSLTIPFWRSLFPRMTVVVCIRNPLEVVSSLKKRGGCSNAFGFNLWLAYNQRLLTDIPPEYRIITHYDAFFSNPQGELQRILAFLGMQVPCETIEQACRAVTISCRNNRSTWSELLVAGPPPEVLDVYDQLCADAGPVYDRIAEDENRKAFRVGREAQISRIESRFRDLDVHWNAHDRTILEEVLTQIRGEHVSSEPLLKAGEMCYHCGLYDGAKYFFDEVLSRDPEDTQALNNLGVLYFQLADLRAAKDFFVRALERNPENREARTNLSQLPDIPDVLRAANESSTDMALSSTRLNQLIETYGYPFSLDLGCGEKCAPGYVGIDRSQLDCVDIVCDVTKGIPLPDECVKEIRSIHFFEHIPRTEINKLIDEVYRILIPGGNLYMRLPYYTHKSAFYSSHLIYWNKDYCDKLFVEAHGFVRPKATFKYSEQIQDKNNPFHQIFAANPEWCRIHLWNVVKEVEYWCRKPE